MRGRSIVPAVERTPKPVRTLAAAFHADPVVRHLLPGEAERRRWLPVAMQFYHDLCLRFGVLRQAAGGEAVIGYVAPGGYEVGVPAIVRLLLVAMAKHRALLPPLRPLAGLFGLLGALDRQHPAEPHFYIVTVAVHPELQGRGLSHLLLDPVLERAEQERVACYLENTNPRNLPIYAGFGFDVLGTVAGLGDGFPPIWRMSRRHRATAAGARPRDEGHGGRMRTP